jgi:hypothetical protein
VAQIRKRLTFANTVAVVALFVALGGTSIGAPVRDKTSELATQAAVKVGISKKTAKTARRALRLAKRADRNAKRALKRNGGANGQDGTGGLKGDKGEKGEKGDAGGQGAAGAPATAMWAVVNSNGTLQRSSGVFDATRIGVGNYKVYFEQNVRNCSYQATPGGPSTIEPDDLGTSYASVGSDPILLNGVSVGLRDPNNQFNGKDFPFHVAVFC